MPESKEVGTQEKINKEHRNQPERAPMAKREIIGVKKLIMIVLDYTQRINIHESILIKMSDYTNKINGVEETNLPAEEF